MQLGAGRLARLVVAGVVLLSVATGYVVVGLRLYGQYRLAEGNYQIAAVGACGTLITWNPPSDVFTAFYANEPSFLSVRYRSPHPQPLRLTLSIPHFTQQQSFDVQGAPAFHTQAFKPPLLDPSVLDSLIGPSARDAQVILQVQSADHQVCNTSWPIRLESRQYMLWQDAAGNDLSPYLAGWVTPRAEVINKLVFNATNQLTHNPAMYSHASALFGYNYRHASRAAVIDQVNAIFDTLQFVYHVEYVNENLPTQENAIQLIKLPKDILSDGAPTGMCVETTAIMASAVEAIGLRPFIVIVPQHAFLGVAVGASPTALIEYWETSDLGSGVTGSQANVDGDGKYHDMQTRNEVLRVIDIAQERQQGIEPIE
jgi:hypothetical protein